MARAGEAGEAFVVCENINENIIYDKYQENEAILCDSKFIVSSTQHKTKSHILNLMGALAKLEVV